MLHQFKGRNRRLYTEWQELLQRAQTWGKEIEVEVVRCNDVELPIEYLIHYNIPSICAIEGAEGGEGSEGGKGSVHRPIFASRFTMRITLPSGYPAIESSAELTFECHEQPHPWHPNIRYFGEFAGRVCLNQMDSFTALAWSVERVASYLRYERYHAEQHPPYPEDMTVARWVREEAEPNGWLDF